jgi:hypothetical protein
MTVSFRHGALRWIAPATCTSGTATTLASARFPPPARSPRSRGPAHTATLWGRGPGSYGVWAGPCQHNENEILVAGRFTGTNIPTPADPAGSESPSPVAKNPTSQASCRCKKDSPLWALRDVPLGLDRVPGISRAGRGLAVERSRPSSHGDPSGCASQATSSITDGVVSTCAGLPNALPLRSWMTWQANSSSGRCADEGNASLRVFRSAEAGLRPLVQAARTRKAVSTSSLGFIDCLLAFSIFYTGTYCSVHRPLVLGFPFTLVRSSMLGTGEADGQRPVL